MRVNLSESIMSSIKESDDMKFRYMLLSRLESDCKYFLGNGQRNERHLWAGNVEKQIAKMRELYNSFADEDKPEWLTAEQIDEYERQMLSKEDLHEAKELNEEFWRDYDEIEYKGVRISIEKSDKGKKCYIPLRNEEFIPERGSQFFSLNDVKNYIDSRLNDEKEDLHEAEELNNKLYIDLDEIIEYAISFVAEKTGATTDIQKQSDGQFMVLLQGNEENYRKYMELHNEVMNLLNN